MLHSNVNRFVPSLLVAGAIALTLGAVGCRQRTGGDDAQGRSESRASESRASESRASETTLTGANVPAASNEDAIGRIASARCAREELCKSIGPERRFTTHDSCVAELRGRMMNELSVDDCPRGIDARALDACMTSIRTESCSNPVDTISRFAACRTTALCLKEAR